MSNQTKHSPLPWGTDSSGYGSPFDIRDANGESAALASVTHEFPRTETRLANVRLIIASVNGFSEALAKAEHAEKLAEALEELELSYERVGGPLSVEPSVNQALRVLAAYEASKGGAQ